MSAGRVRALWIWQWPQNRGFADAANGGRGNELRVAGQQWRGVCTRPGGRSPCISRRASPAHPKASPGPCRQADQKGSPGNKNSLNSQIHLFYFNYNYHPPFTTSSSLAYLQALIEDHLERWGYTLWFFYIVWGIFYL